MDTELNITKHAKRRLKQRGGLGKEAACRTAEIAFNLGMQHEDATGRLRKYLDWLWFQYKTSNNTRIYGEMVYIFRGETLITAVPLPKEHRSAVRKFFSNSKQENSNG